MSGAQWGNGEGGAPPAKLPSGPHRLPRRIVRENQRRRILIAALDAAGERCLSAVTVKDLIGRARVSRATFYELFADKEECVTALHDELSDWLWEEVKTAVIGTSGWDAAVRVAVARTIELLSDDPRVASVCAVEAPSSVVPGLRDRHQRLVEDLCELLRIGRAGCPHGEELPEILEIALVCGAIHLIGCTVVHREGPSADTLASELAELLLTAYRP